MKGELQIMEEVMGYINAINWEEIGNILTNFINEMDIPGFIDTCIAFVKDLFAAFTA